MDQLRKTAETLDKAEATAEQLRHERDKLILQEVANGTPKVHIARAAGISRNMVIRIANNAKKTP